MVKKTPKSVIVVGGSIGGLMHALTLLSLPTPPKVRILERSPTTLLHSQGAGVVALNDTQEFFENVVRLGREIAVTSQLRHYLDRNGGIVPGSVDPRQQRMTSWDLLFHSLRWRVDGLESEYVKGLEADGRAGAVYENGCVVTGVQDVQDGVKVTWNDDSRGEQTEIVDMVIASDGASSTIRRLLRPNVERRYVGYVAWRGTVPEEQLSEDAKEVFGEKFAFYHTTGIQTLGYLIPGAKGTLEPGKRLFNWVWYCNYEEGSPELENLMTDTDGKRHHITLPVGKMNTGLWDKQKEYAKAILPPQYAEAVGKTKQPFIQAVTDVICDQNNFFDGKLLLVGDALAGFRPHTANSTGQAAHDAMCLHQLLSGEIDQSGYDDLVMQFAVDIQRQGVMLGERSQFGRHPFAV